MAETPPENRPNRAMDEAAPQFLEILSDPEVDSHLVRYWLYDPGRKVFYRHPIIVELEKMFDKEFGIEHDDEDDAPRPAA